MHCSSVHIAATSPGHTLVTISVTGHEEHVWSSATFAAYEPLKVSRPGEAWEPQMLATTPSPRNWQPESVTHSALCNLSPHS